MVSFYCSHMRNKVANNMWTNYMLTELANIAGNSARTGTEMKMDASFVLFKAPRRVTFREEDMTVEKMAKIFQVTSQSLYLTGDNNVAVFPRVDGHFSSLNLRDKAHYEVHGAKAAPDASGNVAALGPPPTPSSNSQFRFSRSASSASPSLPPRAQSLKYFTRTVRLGELQSGKLVNSRMVVIRFTEQEASVPSMIAKTKYALGSNKPLILTDPGLFLLT
ncbi:uncharacterized protein LOC126397583 isoform X1 [Epinephelus moara]|uniref:uncharacterized protein LOC126397583 isoform X1 n=1 Tax=Epinephelus moara TaxID=300413 RepID=UPI00214E9BB1|nr:uncharacterized protein LOC126397583 isoform X1 [Epinephelus moara]